MVGTAFHMDPVTHLRSTEAVRAVRLGAALWILREKKAAADAARKKS